MTSILNDRELSALREMRSYERYRFCQASCRYLAKIGFAVVLDKRKRPAYRISDAGINYLEERAKTEALK